MLSFIGGAHNSLFLKHAMAFINVKEYNKQLFNNIFTMKYSFFLFLQQLHRNMFFLFVNFVREVDDISITVFGENKVAAIKSMFIMLTIEELRTFD